ncbi:MAG: DUF2254 family protein [Myxococcota bacterium]
MEPRKRTLDVQGPLGFFSGLALVSGAVYGVLWALDFGLAGPGYDPVTLLSRPGVVPAMLSLTEVTVAVLGVALTVVAIIVELAATRYTPRVSEIFLRDRTNVVVLSSFVVATVLMLWSTLSLSADPAAFPKFLVFASIATLSATLLMLLPYFAYVFEFLSPVNVVRRIERRAIRTMVAVSQYGGDVDAGRSEVIQGVEQLGDVALKSIQNQDKSIGVASIGALHAVMMVSLQRKTDQANSWFSTEKMRQTDSDLVAFHRDVIRGIEERRTWLEMKVLLQFRSVFDESLNNSRDLCHLVAIYLRRLGLEAARQADDDALRLIIRFFNSFLRSAINTNDVRTAYNLLNEYRQLASGLMKMERGALVVRVADRMRHYGQIAYNRNQAFVLETVAYDLSTLVEDASERNDRWHDALLDVLLDVDRAPHGDHAVQEASLRGVRKAQLKMATFYLVNADQERADRVVADLAGESRERIEGAVLELMSTTEREFFEISDRGVNFDYLPPSQRAHLKTVMRALGLDINPNEAFFAQAGLPSS